MPSRSMAAGWRGRFCLFATAERTHLRGGLRQWQAEELRHGLHPAHKPALVPSGNLPIFKSLMCKAVPKAGRAAVSVATRITPRDALPQIIVIGGCDGCGMAVLVPSVQPSAPREAARARMNRPVRTLCFARASFAPASFARASFACMAETRGPADDPGRCHRWLWIGAIRSGQRSLLLRRVLAPLQGLIGTIR